MRATLAILAAGQASRFGRPKHLESVGPSGEALFEYAVCDAVRFGCDRAIFVTAPGSVSGLRAQIAGRIGTAIPFEVVPQEPGDLPTGFRPPAERRKPWGTGHAVLTLRDRIRGPFFVLNADDFYGARAIALLGRRIRDARMTGDPSHLLAGYQLRHTPFSEAGGVNRGICRVDASLLLERLEEVRDIRPSGSGFAGTGDDAGERALVAETLCSMNLWCFQPSVFGRLAAAFQRFHARLSDPLEDDFLLSTAVGGLVETGRARVRVVPIEGRAFGMTYPEDRSAVVTGVAEAVAIGDYPTDLGEWFARRGHGVPG